MDITYDIKSLETVDNDVIINIKVDVIGTENGKVVKIPMDIGLDEPPTVYTPFSDLTEQQVVSWIESKFVDMELTNEILVKELTSRMNATPSTIAPQTKETPWS